MNTNDMNKAMEIADIFITIEDESIKRSIMNAMIEWMGARIGKTPIEYFVDELAPIILVANAKRAEKNS